jgi:hypothetical protein
MPIFTIQAKHGSQISTANKSYKFTFTQCLS